jgi:photosynthetic reaction center H subunit
MHIAAFTRYVDVAQVTLYVFWLFFFGLIFYLRGEDRREGFPLVSDRPPYKRLSWFTGIPKPKTFLLVNGETRMAPRDETPIPVTTAAPLEAWPGAPLYPIGDPMLAAVGPGSYAMLPDVPERMFEDQSPRIVAMRSDPALSIDVEGLDPRGMKVIAADGKVAGVVSDLWVDKSDMLVRYVEVDVPTASGGRSVLVPMPACNVGARTVGVSAVLSTQFAQAPIVKQPYTITQLEEDMVAAYFAAGRLYATPARQEPFI